MLQEAITSPYVDYNYYSETYGGNKIPQDSFDACEKRAEAVLHRISFDRVKRLPEIPDMVRMLSVRWLKLITRRRKKRQELSRKIRMGTLSLTQILGT